MVCLPTPARAAMASTLTLAYPLSRHSESAASRMATRELSLRREASGFLVDVGTYLRVAEDETVRLVTGAHLRLYSTRRVVSSRLAFGGSVGWSCCGGQYESFARQQTRRIDRKSVVEGKRVDLGGRRI